MEDEFLSKIKYFFRRNNKTIAVPEKSDFVHIGDSIIEIKNGETYTQAAERALESGRKYNKEILLKDAKEKDEISNHLNAIRKLNEKELLELRGYFSYNYRDIQDNLIVGEKNDIIDKALEKDVVEKGTILYKNTKLDIPIGEKKIDGYLSTSRKILKENESDFGPNLMIITLKDNINGLYCEDISRYKTEKEVLLKSGCLLKIINKKTKENGKVVYNCELYDNK